MITQPLSTPLKLVGATYWHYDEKIFDECRVLMRETLNELYRRRHDFDNLKTEFGNVAKEKYRAWSEKLSVQTDASQTVRCILGGK